MDRASGGTVGAAREFFHRPLPQRLNVSVRVCPQNPVNTLAPKTNRRHVRSIREDLERRLGRAGMCVVLLGAGGHGLSERREIGHALASMGFVALIPEDDFPRTLGPSLVETAVLARSDVDLVFLNVESWGTATEFGQFQADPRIARKLRVLVRPEYHPVHAPAAGYLSDLYLTHLARHGHVYPVDGRRLVPVPSAKDLVAMLAERYRQVEALGRES